MKRNIKHGLFQGAILADQVANWILSPFSLETWADETISSRCGRLGHRYPYKFYALIIDAIFGLWQGPGHCVNAYKKELARYNCPPSMRAPVKEPE